MWHSAAVITARRVSPFALFVHVMLRIPLWRRRAIAILFILLLACAFFYPIRLHVANAVLAMFMDDFRWCTVPSTSSPSARFDHFELFCINRGSVVD